MLANTFMDLLGGEPYYGLNPATVIALFAVFAASAYAIVHQFAQAFFKTPRHLPRIRWERFYPRSRAKVPLVELNDHKDFREAVAQGTKQYPGRPFQVQHFPHEWVVIPPKFYDEMKSVPRHELSFQQASHDLFLGTHTGIVNHDLLVPTVLRTGSHRLIDSTVAAVEQESLDAVLNNIGPCEDWTTMKLLPKTTTIIMNITQRIFVGESLCHSPGWLAAVVHTSRNAFAACPSLWTSASWMRPWVAWRSPLLRQLRAAREDSKRLLRPIVEEHRAALSRQDEKPPADLVQLVLDATKDSPEGRSLEFITDAIIDANRAGQATTASTLYHLVYDLAAHPECIEPLRDEIRGLSGEPLNRATVNKMSKLDSFIREAQRFSPFSLLIAARKALRKFVLSDGTVLPNGTLIGLNPFDAPMKNSLLKDPDTFDAFRWHRMRQENGREAMYSFLQPSVEHQAFGMGVQACPGRFFAGHAIRLALIRTLIHYDFKLAETHKKSHPMEHYSGMLTIIDREAELSFKKRNPV